MNKELKARAIKAANGVGLRKQSRDLADEIATYIDLLHEVLDAAGVPNGEPTKDGAKSALLRVIAAKELLEKAAKKLAKKNFELLGQDIYGWQERALSAEQRLSAVRSAL